MSETQTRRFFIPPWLDELDIKPNPFRVLCHLLRRAGADGRCNPSGGSIATACHINRDTVWPALEALEKAQLIRRLPKKFGGQNNYLITPPIGGKTGPIEETPIGGKTGVSIGGKEGPVSNPFEVIPLKESNHIDDSPKSDGFQLFPEETPSPTISKNQLAESIYREYPRKESKPAAIKAILKSFKTYPPEHLLERTKAYATAISWKEKQFIPHPATWFNNERFNDDPIGWEQPNKTTNQQTRPKFRGIQEHIELQDL